MRRWLCAVVVAAACAPGPAPEGVGREDSYPAYPPPAGPIGQPGDEPVSWSTSGQWIAVCRPTNGGLVPRLLVGDDLELALDHLEATDPVGRHVVLRRGDQRVLYDTVARREHELGSSATTTWGSFDAQGRRFAHGRRDGERDVVVLRMLATGEERLIVSPIRPLTQVAFDQAGQHLFLAGFERDEEAELEIVGDMCNVRGGAAGPLARRVAAAMIDLRLHDGAVVTLEGLPLRRQALAGAAAFESEAGIELVGATERTRVAGPGCRLELQQRRSHELLVRCDAEQAGERHFVWRHGMLLPLGFEPHPRDRLGVQMYDEIRALRGTKGRWLSMPTASVIQGLAVHTEGHAWADRVLLSGPEAGVDIYRAPDGELVAHHDITGIIRAVRGPFVAIESRSSGRNDGWVIDLRDARIVRTFDAPPSMLSRSGHVAQRDDTGRIIWR